MYCGNTADIHPGIMIYIIKQNITITLSSKGIKWMDGNICVTFSWHIQHNEEIIALYIVRYVTLTGDNFAKKCDRY